MPAALPVDYRACSSKSYFRPERAGSEVGGDFYDVFGDRGASGSLSETCAARVRRRRSLTGFLRHTTVAYAREGAGPAGVLARVNDAMLTQDFEGRFATAILARLGFCDAGVQVTVATAGHPRGHSSSAPAGEAEGWAAAGAARGVPRSQHPPRPRRSLQPGDALAMYTDGLTEAQAPGRVLTVEQLVEQLRCSSPASARATIDALLGLVDVTDGARDDIAILAMRVERAGGAGA